MDPATGRPPHPLASRAQSLVAQIRGAAEEVTRQSRAMDHGVRLGLLTPYPAACSSDVVLSEAHIKGRISTPRSRAVGRFFSDIGRTSPPRAGGHFTGHLDTESGMLRIDHTKDHGFWLEVQLPPSILRPPAGEAGGHPCANAMVDACDRLEDAEDRLRELVAELRADVRGGRASLYSTLYAGDVVLHPASLTADNLSRDEVAGAHIDAAAGVLRAYAHVLGDDGLHELVAEGVCASAAVRLLRDAHASGACPEALARVDGSAPDELLTPAMPNPVVRVELAQRTPTVRKEQGPRVIHVDLGQLVAEYTRVKYRPNGPATLALFKQP